MTDVLALTISILALIISFANLFILLFFQQTLKNVKKELRSLKEAKASRDISDETATYESTTESSTNHLNELKEIVRERDRELEKCSWIYNLNRRKK